jgi:dihydrofolate synthase / folylpolyglutamate synthase
VTYREALAWLYATQKFGIKLGLENTQRLLRALEIKTHGRVIHVAGTNGKGSVCAMIDAICRTAGFRTGLFTSPHLVSFRERIRVDGEMIRENEVALGLTGICDLVRDWDPHPTFFEITTGLALQHFQETRCEIVVLETGMGGRLDATNAINADVSVITPIDLDHQKWLGNSLAEIAGEKAGIIKPGVPVICAEQKPEAAHVIGQRARECNAPLEIVDEPWTRSPVALRGAYQKCNAALAVAAVRYLNIPELAIDAGLRTVEWPARFQIWSERIVIDGAHNPAGTRALVQTWREEFGRERATIVLGILRDKNIEEMLRTLQPIAARFILPRIRSERAVPQLELAQLIASLTPSVPNASRTPTSIASSVGEAIAVGQTETERILITGSLHFAGEALARLRGEPDALEDCLQ